MKEEALDRTVWRTGFGRGNGPVVDRRSEWHRIVSSVGFHDACGKWIKEYGGLKVRQLKGGGIERAEFLRNFARFARSSLLREHYENREV